MKGRKFDQIGKEIYFRTKKGKKHPFVKNHEQINRGFALAKKLNKEKDIQKDI